MPLASPDQLPSSLAAFPPAAREANSRSRLNQAGTHPAGGGKALWSLLPIAASLCP